MTKVLYLAERYSPEFSNNGKIVCLTATACWELEDRKLPYSIPQHYLSDVKLRRDEDIYYKEQLEWLDALDQVLHRTVPDSANLRLTRIHANRIKYLVDDFIIKARQIHAILENEKPTEVYYVKSSEERKEGEFSLYNLTKWDRLSYELLIESAHKARPQDFQLKTIRALAPEIKQAQSSHNVSWRNFKKMIPRKMWKPLQDAFTFRHFSLTAAKAIPREKVLFLDAGLWIIDNLIRQFLSQGCDVFIKSEGEIRHLSSFGGLSAVVKPSHADTPASHRAQFMAAFDIIEREGLLCWADRWAPFKLGDLLKPYFEHLITEEIPRVFSETLQLKDFYKSEGVAAVISRATVGKNYPAALLAAGAMGIPRVCFQHSVGPLNMKSWVDDELCFVDRNFAITTPSEHYFKTQSRQADYQHCQVHEYSNYLFHFKKMFRKKRRAEGKKPILLYVPCKLAHGLTQFNSPLYPMTWYFEHQTKMLTFLNSQTDYEIWYKHTPGQKWAETSLLPFIHSAGLRNVTVKTGLFSDYAGDADRVLFDFPSTGAFEAAAVGLPFLALVHETVCVWPEMNRVFGKSLQSFSDSQGAAEKVRGFLATSADDLLVTLPMAAPPLPQELVSLVIEPLISGRSQKMSFSSKEANRNG